MKKKILLTLLGLVCALCCAFGLTACGGDGGNSTFKVKDKAHWKQTIADTRKSDLIDFSATIKDKDKDRNLVYIQIRSSGKNQYVNSTLYSYDAADECVEYTSEYFYDGEYVYDAVSDQLLGYDWQKIGVNTNVGKQFAEPVSLIDEIYSGEMTSEMGFNVTFDGLDELSERYADAAYNNENGLYTITDGELTYSFLFFLDSTPNKLRFRIESSELNLSHEMGFTSDFPVTIPTESVREVGNGGDTDDGQPQAAEVTAEQWAQILEDANNYTYTQAFADYSGENKVDGNKWELDDGELVHQIIVKNGTTYDVYMENTEPAGWSKMTVSGDSSSVADLEMQFDLAQNMLKVCKDDYSLFDYDDGKYTAAEIDKTATIGIKLQNIVAIFEQGRLVSITFSMGGAEYEFTDFGSTTVTLPATYTESND